MDTALAPAAELLAGWIDRTPDDRAARAVQYRRAALNPHRLGALLTEAGFAAAADARPDTAAGGNRKPSRRKTTPATGWPRRETPSLCATASTGS